MRVEFLDVGRNKLCWSIATNTLDEDFLILEIRKHRALISRGIDIVMHSEDAGLILVGGYRPVGKVQVHRECPRLRESQ